MAGARFNLLRSARSRVSPAAGLIASALILSGCGEPWKERPYDPPVGSRWTIQSEFSDTKTLPNAVANWTTHQRAEMTIEAKTAAGFQVSYVVTEIYVDGDAPEVAPMRPTMPMMKGFVLHARLDASGKPVGIDNLDEARGHMKAFVDATTTKSDDKPKVADLVRSIYDKLLRAEGAEAARNFMPDVGELAEGQNTGMARDEARHESDTNDDPLGVGAPFKVSSVTRVDKVDGKTGDVTYVRDGRTDPESAREFARVLLQKLQISGPIDDVLKQVTIDMNDLATIHVAGGMTRAYRHDSIIGLSLPGLKAHKEQVRTIAVTPAT